MKEALFYDREADRKVRCRLCRFHCLIADGARGMCAVRENRGGTLYSLVYGKICSEHVDPIEKKPLFHVMPGSNTYSIATPGCNFHCLHCQNYIISQLDQNISLRGTILNQQLRSTVINPLDIVQRALDNNCRSISYTYTEPTIFFEFACETARLAAEAGLKNIFVTNGYISTEALSAVAPFLDAANIDLKGFSDAFYHDIVHAKLSEVLSSIIEYRKLGIWLEITTLVIPGLNDSDAVLRGMADFIANNLGVDTPWHVSAFYPTYKLTDRPRTPATTLKNARDIGIAAGLRYVYEGNVPGAGGENTCCPACSAILIKRFGYTIQTNRIIEDSCPDCGCVIAGIGL